MLSQRLRELESAGVIRHRRLAPPAASSVYELTERGRELEPVLLSLGAGARARLPSDAPISTAALLLSPRTMADASAATGPAVSLELDLGDERFRSGPDRMTCRSSRAPPPTPTPRWSPNPHPERAACSATASSARPWTRATPGWRAIRRRSPRLQSLVSLPLRRPRPPGHQVEEGAHRRPVTAAGAVHHEHAVHHVGVGRGHATGGPAVSAPSGAAR